MRRPGEDTHGFCVVEGLAEVEGDEVGLGSKKMLRSGRVGTSLSHIPGNAFEMESSGNTEEGQAGNLGSQISEVGLNRGK